MAGFGFVAKVMKPNFTALPKVRGAMVPMRVSSGASAPRHIMIAINTKNAAPTSFRAAKSTGNSSNKTARPAMAAAAHKTAPNPKPSASPIAAPNPSFAAVLTLTTNDGPGAIAAIKWILITDANAAQVMVYSFVISGASTAFMPTT
jgi:chemotaxis response regulator CheB